MCQYDVRCFRSKRQDGSVKRRALWVMTRPSGCRGIFFHGDRTEVEAPVYTVCELEKMTKFGIEEVTSREALAELADWPEGRRSLQKILDRHEIGHPRRENHD